MKLTIGEALEAMDKNGYPWDRGSFYGGMGASCAIGQMGRNLGIDPQDTGKMWKLHDAITTAVYKKDKIMLFSIVGLNDESKSWEEAKEKIHTVYDPYADLEIEVEL